MGNPETPLTDFQINTPLTYNLSSSKLYPAFPSFPHNSTFLLHILSQGPMPEPSRDDPAHEQLLPRKNPSNQGTGNPTDLFAPPTKEDPQPPFASYDAGVQNNQWSYEMNRMPADNGREDTEDPKSTTYFLSSKIRRASVVSSTLTKWSSIVQKRHPFSDRFESPPFYLLMLHFFFCLMTYPVLFIAAMAATRRTLFWARVIVGMGCSIMGFSLSFTLVGLTQALIEAATWATLIDQSAVKGGPYKGIRLREFCIQADEPKSVAGAIILLWRRWKGRKVTKPYSDHRFWTGYIVLFVFSALLAAALSFIFGRTVDIATISQRQYDVFEEVAVSADLSQTDLEKAAILAPVFIKHRLFTWTIESFSVHGNLPPPLSFRYHNDTVYFAEITQSQLQPGGTGFGTFDWDEKKAKVSQVDAIEPQNRTTDADDPIEPGAVLVFPRWGLRTHCERIPNLGDNLIVFANNSGITYLFTPRDTVRTLFGSFGLPVPAMVDEPLNVSATMYGDDTIPDNMTVSSWMIGVPYWSNGVSNNVKSTNVSLGHDGRGFVTIENVLIRLNNSYAPHSTFAHRDRDTIPDADGNPTFIGFDAAVCLQLYEPWILDVYNSSTGPPTTMRIRQKVDLDNWKNTLWESSSSARLKGNRIVDPSVKRFLNSSGYSPAYIAAHENSVNQVAKDNGRDSFYVPSPSLVSFTNGSGPFGYTEFSADLYATARSLSDASNVLPYLAGSGQLVARRYQDRVVAIASLRNFDLSMALGLVFMTGLLCTIAVPRLPLGVPKRGFNLYSWILAFHAKEVEVEGGEQIVRGMHLDELEEYAGDAILRYRIFDRENESMQDD
ncbi:hypothetical protein BJ165DRAFT_758466 [Panaeolus papilionaceus]|nr:hypothetical protein BJ165DRAFT_758466 [Panaeolus papilionaceus]